MGRARKTNPLQVLLEIVSWLPWWLGLAFAAIAYIVLHAMSGQVQLPSVKHGQISAFITQSLVTVFASIGQYVVPSLVLAGAVVSFFRRKHRSALVRDMACAQSSSALNDLSWRDGRQRRNRWLCRHLGSIYQQRQSVCCWSQCAID